MPKRGKDSLTGSGWHVTATCLYALTALLFVVLNAEHNPFLWLAYYEVGSMIGLFLFLIPHRGYLRKHWQDVRDISWNRKAFYLRHNLAVPTSFTLFGTRSPILPAGGSVGFIIFAIATGIAPAAIVVAIRGSRGFITTFVMNIKMAKYGYHLSRKHAVMLAGALLALCAIVLADKGFYSDNPLTQGALLGTLVGICLGILSLLLSLGDITLHRRTRMILDYDISSRKGGNTQAEESALLPVILCSFFASAMVSVVICIPIVAGIAILSGSVSFGDYNLLEGSLIVASGAIITPAAHLSNNRAIIRGRNLKIRVITFGLPAVAAGYLTLYSLFTDYQQNIVWWLFIAGLALMISVSVLMFLTSSQTKDKAGRN